MKKIFLLSVMALVAFSACTKEERFENEIQAGFTIKANIADVMDESKISISNVGKNTWSDGDSIAVFFGGKAYKFVLADGAGSGEGLFACEKDLRGQTENGVAVYPYSSGVSLSGSQLSFNIPQTWAAESTPAPMAASKATSGNYSFRNVGAILRVQYTNLPSMADKLRLTASNDIYGKFTLSNAASSNMSIPSTKTKNVVTVTLPKVRKDGNAYVDIPVGAGSLSSIKAELLGVDGSVLNTTNSTATKTFTVGHVKPLTAINIPGNRMKVEWIWDAGSLPCFRSNVPAIDDNGNVYVTTNESALYKISNTGTLLWRTALNNIGGKVETSPSIEPDGSTVYFAGGQDGAGAIYALSGDGNIKWNFKDWPSFPTGRNFWQSFIGVDSKNLYLAVGTMCIALTVDKASGARVSYGVGKTDGTQGNLNGPGAGVAIGKAGTVSVMSSGGAYTWKKSLLDNPTQTNATYGKFANWSYQDLWPGWGAFHRDKPGVVAIKKGPTSGIDAIVSCAQEAKGRINVVCYPASFATSGAELQRHDDNVYKYYWRHQIGSNTNDASAPADQDQGGIVIGHENLVVIVPMKYRAGTTAPNVTEAGLYTIWMGRTTDGGTTCWRVRTGGDNVSGAAAVDNRGYVHFSTDGYYYIVKPNTANGGSYEIEAKINLRNLLLSSGLIGNIKYTGCWSSVKIAKNGKIYLNINLDSSRGITCCFTYPGVTGPDATSSWPQKGADQYNSSQQQL